MPHLEGTLLPQAHCWLCICLGSAPTLPWSANPPLPASTPVMGPPPACHLQMDIQMDVYVSCYSHHNFKHLPIKMLPPSKWQPHLSACPDQISGTQCGVTQARAAAKHSASTQLVCPSVTNNTLTREAQLAALMQSPLSASLPLVSSAKPSGHPWTQIQEEVSLDLPSDIPPSSPCSFS